jgi:hypothetical protein
VYIKRTRKEEARVFVLFLKKPMEKLKKRSTNKSQNDIDGILPLVAIFIIFLVVLLVVSSGTSSPPVLGLPELEQDFNYYKTFSSQALEMFAKQIQEKPTPAMEIQIEATILSQRATNAWNDLLNCVHEMSGTCKEINKKWMDAKHFIKAFSNFYDHRQHHWSGWKASFRVILKGFQGYQFVES